MSQSTIYMSSSILSLVLLPAIPQTVVQYWVSPRILVRISNRHSTVLVVLKSPQQEVYRVSMLDGYIKVFAWIVRDIEKPNTFAGWNDWNNWLDV